MKAPSEESPDVVRVLPRPEAVMGGARPPLGAIDEAGLCRLALMGDMGAWNALVQKHNHRVVVSLLARGARVDRAKDLAQDAWLRLIEQQREGRLSHLQLPGLAITQAGFLWLEAARRARRTEAAAEPPTSDLADPGADAETRLLAEEQLARAERVLSRCSPSAKKVFHLVYGGDGLSHAEVAEKLGLSLQRVRQIVCEVRKLLRDEMEDGTSAAPPRGGRDKGEGVGS
jgi:RNA polymerase sigma factor (sigma-70 family)